MFNVKVKEHFVHTNKIGTDIKHFKKNDIYKVFYVKENGQVDFLIFDEEVGFIFIEANKFEPSK